MEEGCFCQSFEDLHLIREGFDFDQLLRSDINSLTFRQPPLSLFRKPPALAVSTSFLFSDYINVLAFSPAHLCDCGSSLTKINK